MPADSASAADLLAGHPNAVYGVDWSPDGKLIASASLDNSVKLWDPTTGKQLARMPGHGDGVSAVVFSADNKTLFSSSLDRSIKIWNVASRSLTTTVSAHANYVWALARAHNGKTIVSGGYDNILCTWTPTGSKLQAVTVGSQPVLAVASAPPAAGGYSVAASKDSNAYIIDPDATASRLTLTGHTGAVEAVLVSHDGKTIHTAGQDKTIRSWNSRTGEVNRIVEAHDSYAQCLALSTDGKQLASGSQSGEIKLWNAGTGRLVDARGERDMRSTVARQANATYTGIFL
jgi:WD40 repeat protein